MHVEEHGGLFQIQGIHHSVESRKNNLLFPEPQSIESAKSGRAWAAEASVLETSARAHIHTRDVASAAVTVA